MSRRNLATSGLSYVEANRGRVNIYTFDSDVIAARKRIERDYPRLQILWDNETHEHLIVQTTLDGTQELLFACKDFYEDLVRAKIESCNNEKRDVWLELEEAEAKAEANQEKQFAERIHEAGEKLAFAFAQDGLTVRPRMTPRSIPIRKKRALPNFEAPR